MAYALNKERVLDWSHGESKFSPQGDLVSQVLMICGSLMAVANGLIPSLGAMIYGKLTDELVIRENWNCTLNESVTTLLLRNVVTLEMIQPRGLIAINTTETKSVQVTVNETGIRVKVVGLNGKLHHQTAFDIKNATSSSIVLNGTALDGTKLMGIIVMGMHVEMVKLKEKAILNDKKVDVMEKGETGNTKGEEIIGNFSEGKHEMKSPLTRNGIEKRVSFFYHKREADKFTNQSNGTSSDIELMKEGFGNSRKTIREFVSYGKKAFIVGKSSKTTVNSTSNLEKYFVGKHKETRKTHKPLLVEAHRTEEGEAKEKMSSDETRGNTKWNATDKKSTVQPSNRTKNSETIKKTSDDGISVGKVQSIKKLPATPTPTVPPETNNVNYTLRNITRTCRLIQDRIEENMSKYALYYVYAAIGTLVFAYGQMVMWNIASERGVRNLSENLTDSMMDKDPGFYDTKIHEGVVNLQGLTDPQEAISKSDLSALTGGLGGEIAYMIQSLSSMMSGFLVSFIENWKITLVMMAAGPVLVAVQGIADKVQKIVMRQKEDLMKRASGLARKSMGSIKTVASYAGEKLEKARYSGKVEAANNLNKLKSLILGVQKGLTTLLAFGFLGLGFWYSSTLLPGGSITPGAVMTIFMAIISGVMQMAGTGEQVEDIGDARTALSSLFGISETDEDPFDKATSQLDTVLGKLDVFNVYFHYPSRPEYQVLKSINFTVEESQTVALLGDKGSGKSALIKLLQRIHDPQTGKVRLDRQDVRFLDRRWFRQQIGIVHKRPELFNTSIADNIAYGKGEATLTEIVHAAKAAGAHEFIITLPDGYATVLCDDGFPLTSYQKHLVALARALIRNPRIFLWEEDLSIMDNSSFDALTNYLNEARRGRTTVISTSHVSVARIADIIVVLHNGEIIEQGSPEELMLSGGAFRYLATLQYFESLTLHQEKLSKTAPVASQMPVIKKGIEELESDLMATQEQTKEQVNGFLSKIRHMIQEKLNEGEAAYKMIRMQLQDLPLLLSGALGAAITGMVAPGLSFLFGEIQKFMNDPLRVAREGPFWASMFVLLGAVVGFGGTIEKLMLTFATEKLKTRLQKLAFDTAINKNSVPQNSGIGDVFPGGDGQVPQSTAFGLSFVPGVPTQQFRIPSQALTTGMDGLPLGQIPGMGDGPALAPGFGGGFAQSVGNPISTVPGVGTQPFGIPQSLPSGMEALTCGRISEMPDGTSTIFPRSIGHFPGVQETAPTSLPAVPGMPSEQLPFSEGISTETFSLGLQGRLSEQIPGLGDVSATLPRTGRLSLPSVPGAPLEQLQSFGAIPSEVLSSGMKALPSGQTTQTSDTSSLLPGVVGQLPCTPQPMGLNLPSLHGVPTEQLAILGGSSFTPGSPGLVAQNISPTMNLSSLNLAQDSDRSPGMAGISLPQTQDNIPSGRNPQGLGVDQRLPGNLTQLSRTGVTELGLDNGQLPVGGSIPCSLPLTGNPKDMVPAGGMVPLPGTPMNGYNALAVGSQWNSGEVPQRGISSIRGVMPARRHCNANNVPSYTDQRGIQELGGMGLPPNMPSPRPDLLVLPDPQQQADQLMSQVEKDVEAALQNSIGKYLGPKVQETISSVSTLGMALYNGWKMTLVVLAGLPIIGLANRIQQNEADAIVEPEGVEALMKTSFKKMETISALGMENRFAKKYKDAIFEKYKQALKKIIASGFAFALGQAMVFFIYAAALRFGCYLISIGDMAAIEVLGVLMTVLFGSYATSNTRAPSHAHKENEDSVNRLFDGETPNVQDHIGDKLDEVEGNLEFKHVELPDPLHNGTPLLSQMNVRVRKGQKLAIVQLDSEKVNPFELLLERFFDPVAGTLLLDGADIRSLDLSWLRSHHAVVSHRCFLSHYSIADNIAYGDNRRRVTQTEIEDAAYSAYAHEFIVDLPQSYETIPDEDQIKLSDSQKLRIVIARTIIRGSPLIILDQLEEEDQAVTDATDILCRDRTCLILTRQRQTIETADHIILMYHGRILEQGSLNELLAQRRLFYLLTNLADADEF